MTQVAQLPRAVWIGTGGRGPFTIQDENGVAINIPTDADVVVERYDSTTDTTPDILVLNTDYTLSGLPSAPTITLTTAQAVLSSTERILITRVSGKTQDLDLTASGDFNSEAIEARFDEHLRMIQETHLLASRSVRQFGLETTGLTIPPVTSRASKYAGWDLNGKPVALDLVNVGETITLGTNWSAALAAALGEGWATQLAQAYVGDDAQDYGAVADGVTDDTTALQNALNAGLVELENGKTYKITSQLTASIADSGFYCEGQATILMGSDANEFDAVDHSTPIGSDALGFYASGLDRITLRGVRFQFETTATPTATSECRTARAVRIDGGEGHYVDVEAYGFQETNGGIVEVNSITDPRKLRVFVHDCGSAASTAALANLSTGQITALDIDANRVSLANSQRFHAEVTADNLAFTGDAFTKFGYQSDGLNVQSQGSTGGSTFVVQAENVDEAVDLYGDDMTGLVGCSNVFHGVKLINGAQNNNVQATVNGTRGAPVVFTGSNSASQDTSGNRVDCTAQGVGSVSGGTTLAGLEIGDDSSLTYKVTDNDIRIIMTDSASAQRCVDVQGGERNNIEWYADAIGTGGDYARDQTTAKTNVFKAIGANRANLHVYESADTAYNTAATITYDTEESDVTGEFNTSTSVYTANAPRKLAVDARLRTAALNAGKFVEIQLYHTPNGGSAALIGADRSLNASGSAVEATVNAECVLSLGVGDTLNAVVVHDHATTLTSTGAVTQTDFRVMEVG